jgi:NADH-quinone oxidoreductase subunit J
MPFYVAAAIAAAGLLLVLRPGRAAMRRAGAVIGLAGFGMLMAQGLKLAGPSDGSVSTPFYMAFAAIGIIGAVRVITHPRPVFAAIYFVLTVLAAGGYGRAYFSATAAQGSGTPGQARGGGKRGNCQKAHT